MATKEEILSQLIDIFHEMFEIERESVTLSSELYEDLDIDSIDAVDMMVKLKEITGERLDPEEFKSVRTVEDCVNAIHVLYARTANTEG